MEHKDGLRNQHFFRPSDGSIAALFPHNRFFIQTVKTLHDSAMKVSARSVDGEIELGVLARLYLVIMADTDGDGRLNTLDAKTIMIAAADGRRLTKLIDGVDAIYGPVTHASNEVRMVVEKTDGTTLLVRFDLQSWEIAPPISLPLLRAN